MQENSHCIYNSNKPISGRCDVWTVKQNIQCNCNIKRVKYKRTQFVHVIKMWDRSDFKGNYLITDTNVQAYKLLNCGSDYIFLGLWHLLRILQRTPHISWFYIWYEEKNWERSHCHTAISTGLSSIWLVYVLLMRIEKISQVIDEHDIFSGSCYVPKI